MLWASLLEGSCALVYRYGMFSLLVQAVQPLHASPDARLCCEVGLCVAYHGGMLAHSCT